MMLMRHRSNELNRRAWALRWRHPALAASIAERVRSGSADALHRARASRTLTWVAKWRGDFEAANAHAKTAIKALRGGEDAYAFGDVCSLLGVLYYSRGDIDSAQEICLEGLEAVTDLPPRECRIDLLVTLATLHQYSLDFDRCHDLLDEARDLAITTGNIMDVSRIEHNRARALRRAGESVKARNSARRAVQLAALTRNRVIAPYAGEVMGAALLDLGNPGAALMVLRVAEARAFQIGDRRAQCQILEQLGRAETAKGRPLKAVHTLRRGLSIAEDMGYLPWRQSFTIALAENAEAVGNLREALGYHKAAAVLNRQLLSAETETRLSAIRATFEYREARAAAAHERARAVELAHAAEAAKAASQLKSQFLANMSHELRTPLNGILGFNQLLQMTELTPTQYEYTEMAISAGEALLSLINDILDISQIEAGAVRLEARPFSIRDAIGRAGGAVRGLAQTRGLAVHSAIDTNLPDTLIGDEDRITQIMVNFAGNALKFTEQGQIVFIAGRTAQGIRLGVRDTGPGVPPERRKMIFERFRQGEDTLTKRHKGAGLGLAICAELVRLMDGDIGVDEAPGGGAEFWIVVPERTSVALAS